MPNPTILQSWIETFERVAGDRERSGEITVHLFDGKSVNLLDSVVERDGSLCYIDESYRAGTFPADEWSLSEKAY